VSATTGLDELPSTLLQRRTVPLRGTSLTYHVARPDAPGRPVVLLHPWFGCWRFWSTTIAALADRPCYALDLYSPAAGDWTGVEGPVALAEAVVGVLDAERIEVADVVGNSLGGIVSQLVAATVPQRVHRLVLVGTGATTAGTLPGFAAAVDRWIATAEAGGAAAREAVEDTVGMLVTARPAAAEWTAYVDAVLATDPAYLAAALAGARLLDLTPRLPAITADTLVVRGSEDCARTAEHAATLAAGIPRARSVELPGAGHSPMVDHPAEFTALVRAHLDGGAAAAEPTEPTHPHHQEDE
jgi:3-oxoadipate enol-lactonase